MTGLLRRATTVAILPVGVAVGTFTAVRAVRRAHHRKAEAELWAEATKAASEAP
jgi:hypothetical protein